MIRNLTSRITRALNDSPARVHIPSLHAQDMDSHAVSAPVADLRAGMFLAHRDEASATEPSAVQAGTLLP